MKKLLSILKKDERGLTLVELLAVVVILAIVGGIAFVSIGKVIENSKADAHVANAQQLISAAKLYEANAGNLSSVTSETLKTEGFIGELMDPWTKKPEDYSGTVTKSGDVYSVTMDGGTGCTITSVPETVINEGRKVACGYTSGS
ncbi:type II secretion system protein [Bacillus sp. FJAT-50079]|uniref:type II secretion system protein n=1 Tax=Bacillus sp. FJAT-50079 TaxID=2833577 RepID=UPI0020163063|nr:type II secretion system protein [Bacillus sp. FJAT-50079]